MKKLVLSLLVLGLLLAGCVNKESSKPESSVDSSAVISSSSIDSSLDLPSSSSSTSSSNSSSLSSLTSSSNSSSSTIEQYTITWKNWDGSVLKTDNVLVGVLPSYDGATPIRPQTVTTIYTFNNWSPTVVIAIENAVYTAQYTEETRTYNVIWKNWDGSVLETDNNVLAGSTPTYNGAVPTRPSSASKNYIWTSWTPTLSSVLSDIEYTAVFEEQVRQYTITWNNENGELLGTTQVNDGVIPTNSYTGPSDTAEWDYTFNGWATSQNGSVLSSLPIASGNATYYAIVSQVKKQYTITFDSKGGSAITPITVDYGTVVSAPTTKPTLEGYKFVAWCTNSEATIPATFPITLTQNITLYASYNVKVDLGVYLSALLTGYELNPYQYIPDKMQAGGNAFLQANTVQPDYSNFVNVSAILQGGYGEQWQMVLDNLQQTYTFFNVLTAVEAISASAVVGFNNYLDTNPGNTANYTFVNGIYSVAILFDGTTMTFVIDYSVTVSSIGTVSAQIALTYNITTSERTGRIQLGDANVIKYSITENSYTFAIRYLGIRRAYFSVERKQNGDIEGAIFEFLGLDESVVSTSSATQFLITSSYVSVVGNKAGSMVGWSGYINELYNSTTGKLLGYEVQEKLSVITFNTLWFNLIDTTGITSVKALTAPIEDANPHLIYVNGSSTQFVAKKVGGLGTKMTSRRYDIEMRTQYFYYLDGEETIKVAVQTPMLFVQEEQLSTLPTDITSSNSQVSSFSLLVSTTIQNKIKADYATMIPIFINNKENITVNDILSYIGSKIII
ncbi:MAG: InlB B-repeat-containing protein [Bacillales bacterium]|jgi:hypothetical protein|nr:InlB B-repeat-containing protein [Bacillales bacterium]